MDDRGSLFRQMSESAFLLSAAEAAAHDGRTAPAATRLDVGMFVAARAEPASGFALPGIGAAAASATAESAVSNVGTGFAASGGCLESAAAMADNMGDSRPGIRAAGDEARARADDGNESAAACAHSVPAGPGSNLEAPVADIGCSEIVVRAGPVPFGTLAELDSHLHCETVLSVAAPESHP